MVLVVSLVISKSPPGMVMPSSANWKIMHHIENWRSTDSVTYHTCISLGNKLHLGISGHIHQLSECTLASHILCYS